MSYGPSGICHPVAATIITTDTFAVRRWRTSCTRCSSLGAPRTNLALPSVTGAGGSRCRSSPSAPAHVCTRRAARLVQLVSPSGVQTVPPVHATRTGRCFAASRTFAAARRGIRASILARHAPAALAARYLAQCRLGLPRMALPRMALPREGLPRMGLPRRS